MLRGKHHIDWRRTVVALIAAALATIATLRLVFLPEPAIQDDSSTLAADVAGRLDNGLISAPAIVEPAPEPIAISLTVDHTSTAGSWLQDAGLATDEANRWEALLNGIAGTDKFGKGHLLTLFRDPETGDLRGFKYNLDDRVAVSGKAYGNDVFHVSQELIRYTFHPVAVSFRLKEDFWHEADRHDLPRPIAETLANAFRYNRPLDSLPHGSAVKLIYQERVSRDGSTRFATGIQAATISFEGRTLSAFAFRDENGQPRLYDTNGVALGPQALRFPLNFQFISSGFSASRYHPILHRFRAHEGVDLVAKYGTPVKAVADGQIEQAGWCGELGRCIRIRHAGGIVSVYGHLSAIASGIDEGRDVRMGELIGQVGSSGLSTGPHLHYAIEKDGRYVNPLEQNLGEHHEVSPRLRAVFDHFKSEYLAALDHLPLGGHYNVALPADQPMSSNLIQASLSDANPKSPSEHHVRHRMHVQPVVANAIDGRSSVMR